MTDTIYLVTDGEYSDYQVLGAFTSKEKAEIAQRLYPDSCIEECGLDFIPEHPPGMVAWFVNINTEDMSDIRVHQTGPIKQTKECLLPRGNTHYNPQERFIVQCWARDAEHAQKIALDKFYQFQATQQGVAL